VEECLVDLYVIKARLDDSNQEVEHHDQYEENIKEVDYPNDNDDEIVAFKAFFLDSSQVCVLRMQGNFDTGVQYID
jgi:hypothetical protein